LTQASSRFDARPLSWSISRLQQRVALFDPFAPCRGEFCVVRSPAVQRRIGLELEQAVGQEPDHWLMSFADPVEMHDVGDDRIYVAGAFVRGSHG
jgi:hypothetical protein